ncbi:MAG: hypothetical protein ACLURV_12675 [Gallintestinimicrobium sp.]
MNCLISQYGTEIPSNNDEMALGCGAYRKSCHIRKDWPVILTMAWKTRWRP